MTPVLELIDVHYEASFAGNPVPILKGCDYFVEAGTSLAIVGRSGSGKSTLLSLMAGLDEQTTGSIRLFGQSLMGMSEDQRAALRAQHIGFVFQNFQLIAGMTALENVMLPLELFGESDIKQRAEAVLGFVELSHRLHHYPSSLSGGEQQRVAIARALVSRPALIFADEPTGNLDETTAQMIQQLLLSLTPKTTLIVVTHDLDFASQCQQRVHLVQGKLVPVT